MERPGTYEASLESYLDYQEALADLQAFVELANSINKEEQV